MEEMNWVLRQEVRDELEVLSLYRVEPLRPLPLPC
jgi:hypothetical protein